MAVKEYLSLHMHKWLPVNTLIQSGKVFKTFAENVTDVLGNHLTHIKATDAELHTHASYFRLSKHISNLITMFIILLLCILNFSDKQSVIFIFYISRYFHFT